MSRVYWQTRNHGTAELSGSERAYAHCLARDLTMAIIWPMWDPQKVLPPFLALAPRQIADVGSIDKPPKVGATNEAVRRWGNLVKTWLFTGGSVLVDKQEIPFHELSLNTLVTMSRPLRLLAWLDGLCESHGYWEGGPSHALLAYTIREGLKEHILRRGEGWDEVLALIDAAGGEPIIWSYSVTDIFPASPKAWDRAYARLRDQEWPVALDLSIDQGFLSGRTAFDFAAQL